MVQNHIILITTITYLTLCVQYIEIILLVLFTYCIGVIFIFQERRALLFCKEDRAILCKECDLPIHRANEHTQKHNRFLLTGVQLSSAVLANYNNNQTSSSSMSPTGSEASNAGTNNLKARSGNSGMKSNSISTTDQSTPGYFQVDCIQEGSVSTGSISEYLIETLPGWHVEDLLQYPCSSQYGKDLTLYSLTITIATPFAKQCRSTLLCNTLLLYLCKNNRTEDNNIVLDEKNSEEMISYDHLLVE